MKSSLESTALLTIGYYLEKKIKNIVKLPIFNFDFKKCDLKVTLIL